MLEPEKDILVLNIMNTFDTVLIKISRFRDHASLNVLLSLTNCNMAFDDMEHYRHDKKH